MTEEFVQRIALGAFIAFLIAVWVWETVGARIWRQRQRNALANKLARDVAPPKGPFAVYLRAFRHPAFIGLDQNLGAQLKSLILNRNTGADGHNGVRPLESALADILDKEMPVVGLGRPHDGVKQSGAGLVRTTDAEWKAVVTGLLDRCSVIIMSPAGTAGTAWEIEQLGARPEWREKTIYFMPNYQVELIRALQPLVTGHEVFFGTSAVPKKPNKQKQPESIILYAIRLPFVSLFAAVLASVRFLIDVAFAGAILFQRFAQSIGLRARWGKARKAGSKVGLAFPGYTAKGRIFTIDEQGRPHKLTDLDEISPDKLKSAVVHFAKEAEKISARRAKVAPPPAPVAEPTPTLEPVIEASPPGPIARGPSIADESMARSAPPAELSTTETPPETPSPAFTPSAGAETQPPTQF